MNTGAQRTALYRDRAKNGLDRIESPWQWLTQAEAARIAQDGYRRASWACRKVGTTQAEFVRLWLSAMATSVVQAGNSVGVLDLDQMPVADQLEEPPSSWRPQYPQFVKGGRS